MSPIRPPQFSARGAQDGPILTDNQDRIRVCVNTRKPHAGLCSI